MNYKRESENNIVIRLCILFYIKLNMSIRYTFSSNHNIRISSCGLCFGAPDPLIDKSLLKSFNQRVLSLKTKVARTFMNVVI